MRRGESSVDGARSGTHDGTGAATKGTTSRRIHTRDGSREICSQPLQLALAFVVIMSVLMITLYTITAERLDMEIHSLRRRADHDRDVSESLATLSPLIKPNNSFAYMLYVTNDMYLCAAIHFLHHLVHVVLANVTAIDLVVLHSTDVSEPMQIRIQQLFNARMIPVETLYADAPEFTWIASLTKLYAFREWGYDRVVYIDADSVPLQNLDHLFLLPPAPLYAPTAYWLEQACFASTLMVIEPSNKRFVEMIEWARDRGEAAGYDMDILNALYRDTVKLLPGDYTVLNSNLMKKPGDPTPLYPTVAELKRHAKLVHFSCQPDGSYGKPWNAMSADLYAIREEGYDPLFAQLFRDYWDTETVRCRAYP